jgi:F-type H+-transporting ATPase subunit a
VSALRPGTRLAALASPLLLAALAPASALASKPKVDPTKEFKLEAYVPIHIGPLDLSINKAVIYLWIAAAIAVVGTTLIIRGGLKLRPSRVQMFTELVYDFCETSIGRASLPQKLFSTWFPYLATLFVFIWVSNLISYIPLPFDTEHKWAGGIPGFTLYAATANLSVTLALALVTFCATHYVGIKYNGVRKYFASWMPQGVGLGLKLFIGPLEVLSQLLRLVSLSVRLFANMLAGHLLILMSVALIIIIGSAFVAVVSVPVGIFFYLFEVLLVANLQAFIFAILSGIYIGFAVEPPH